VDSEKKMAAAFSVVIAAMMVQVVVSHLQTGQDRGAGQRRADRVGEVAVGDPQLPQPANVLEC
jgi:hypothetical protein